MLGLKRDIFVFGGPSLELIPQTLLKNATFLPPIKRGDLETLMHAQKPAICLIVDGVFGANMSITPTECRQLMERGWMLCGCSSMGALRAADLWSLGMIGLGSIYNLFRLGYLKSDADVAVAYEKDNLNHFKELTVSIVHLIYVLKLLQNKNEIDQRQLKQMLLQAKKVFWVDRTWDALFHTWDNIGINRKIFINQKHLLDAPEFHPKKIDALEAIRLLNDNAA